MCLEAFFCPLGVLQLGLPPLFPPLLPRVCGSACVWVPGFGGKTYGEGAPCPCLSPPPFTPVVVDACIPGYPGLLTPCLTLPPPAPRLCLLSQMLKVSAVLCVCAAAWCSQALAAAAAVAAAGGRSDGGNFLDDKQWLTTISQYDKEVGQWNKFRDVSAAHPHPRTQERAARRRGPRRLGGGRTVGSILLGEGLRESQRRSGAGEVGSCEDPLPGGARGRLACWLRRSSGLTRFPLASYLLTLPLYLPTSLGPQRFAKCWLYLPNFWMLFLAIVNTADAPLRCIATEVTRIDPVTNGPLRNLREEVGRCKIYKCRLSKGWEVVWPHQWAEVELLLIT